MAKNVRVTELDFDQIKANLKNFMRDQSEFTDYDFEGSNLSVLIDLLAYNTHYNAVLANMVSNEMFLDTALKRSSVVSLAKQIGYTPQSVRSAQAVINLTLQNIPSQPNFLTLNPYTAFTTNIDGTAYTFYNVQSYSATPNAGVYTFTGIKLYQGRRLEYFYTVDTTGPTAKYVIPNLNVDTTTLQVAVQYSGIGGFGDTYAPNTVITDLDSTSRVYFLDENTEGYYEVYFGDDIIGRKLSAGDVVRLSYLISDGAAANVSTNVAVGWSTNTIAGESSIDRTITTTSKPSGGSNGDTIDQIRFKSTKSYEAQNRAVTKDDYATIIQQNLPGAESVNVWGGENNNPPVWGKTFISIKPKTGYVLTQDEKNRIVTDILQPRSMMTAQHEFTDPTYTQVTFDLRIRYNASRTNLSAAQIQALAYNKIVEFMNNNLEKFNASFYRSQLEEQLMRLDDSIVSTNILFSLQKRLPLIPGVRFDTVAGFILPAKLHPNELRSSYFYFTDVNGLHTAQLRDVPDASPPDYEGTGRIQTYDLNTGEILDANVGVVDYGAGTITLNSKSPLVITGYVGTATALYVDFGVQESVGDLIPDFNEILILNDAVADPLANIRNGISIDIIAVNN